MVEPMMTARQVAELLRVHENWVYDQAASGQLPGYKIGGARRFHPEEIDSWIAGHRERQRQREISTRAGRGARVRTRERQPEPPRETTKPTKPRRRRRSAANESDDQPRLFEN